MPSPSEPAMPRRETAAQEIVAQEAGAGRALPLSRFRLATTRDVGESRRLVAGLLQPHDLRPLTRSGVDTTIHYAPLDRLAVMFVRYGGDVVVDPGAMERFFLLMTPTAGRMGMALGDERIDCGIGTYPLCSPGVPFRMTWTPETAILSVRIDRDGLRSHLSDLLGDEVTEPIVFDVVRGLDCGRTPGWAALLDFVTTQLQTPASPLGRGRSMRETEALILSTVLNLFPHNFTEALRAEVPPAEPRTVARALDYIHAHAKNDVSIADIVAAAGTSARTLFRGFRESCGTTPMAYLRNARLDGARRDCAAADPAHTTVTRIATDWGFFHAGDFAACYRRRFGENPSETLGKARRAVSAGRPEGRAGGQAGGQAKS